MNTQGTTITRGSIIKVPDATPGLLFANGQQQSFTLERVWKSAVAPAVNMAVAVEVDGAGAIQSVTVVDQGQINKERLSQLGGVAQERGKEAAKLAQQGVGALAGRMGAVALGAAVVFAIAVWFLPSANIGQALGALVGGAGNGISLTFWTLLGVSFSNPQSVLAGSGGFGFLTLLGLLAIVAPFAAPFLKTAWSHYLNAAPLAIVVIGFLSTWMGERKAFAELAQLGAPSPFSWSWGFYIVLLASLVLAAQVMKGPSRA